MGDSADALTEIDSHGLSTSGEVCQLIRGNDWTDFYRTAWYNPLTQDVKVTSMYKSLTQPPENEVTGKLIVEYKLFSKTFETVSVDLW